MVSYTNINGLVSTLSEINDYLRAKKPYIFSFVATRLSNSEDVPVREGQYNVWRQNRNQKKGGRVMVLTRKDVIMGKPGKHATSFPRGVMVKIRWKLFST